MRASSDVMFKVGILDSHEQLELTDGALPKEIPLSAALAVGVLSTPSLLETKPNSIVIASDLIPG